MAGLKNCSKIKKWGDDYLVRESCKLMGTDFIVEVLSFNLSFWCIFFDSSADCSGYLWYTYYFIRNCI